MDWQKVAYDNAYAATKQGQSLSQMLANTGEHGSGSTAYKDTTTRAYNDASRRSTTSSAASTAAPSVSLKPKALPSTAKPAATSSGALAIPAMPTLDIPKLTLSKETNVNYQLDKMLGTDSLTMRRANTLGRELSARSGHDRGSMGAGTVANVMIDKATPIAQTSATTAYNSEVASWQAQVKRNTDVYQAQYKERLDALGYDQRRIESIMQANTSLTTATMQVASNNPTHADWVTTNLLHPAQNSNNSFVGGIYSF